MNIVNIIGRLTREPEVRYTKTNKAVCDFTLAVGNGEITDFVPCICWNKTAENLSKYQHKGNQIGITGKFTSDSYEDKDGNKRTRYYVMVNQLEFLTPKSEFQDITDDDPFGEMGKKVEEEIIEQDLEITDDDLPF